MYHLTLLLPVKVLKSTLVFVRELRIFKEGREDWRGRVQGGMPGPVKVKGVPGGSVAGGQPFMKLDIIIRFLQVLG